MGEDGSKGGGGGQEVSSVLDMLSVRYPVCSNVWREERTACLKTTHIHLEKDGLGDVNLQPVTAKAVGVGVVRRILRKELYKTSMFGAFLKEDR